MDRTADRTFHGLDALRAVAAVSVLLLHLGDRLGTPWMAPSGYLAVDLFFVMSGFVVARSYGDRMKQLGVAGFMRVRVVRFLPLFYLGGLLGLLRVGLLAIGGHPDLGPSQILPYFLFLPAPPSGDSWSLAPLNLPAWSLLLEVYINLAFALLLPLLSNRVLAAIVLLSGAGIAIASAILPHLGDAAAGTSLLRVLYSFPLGVLLYRLRDRLSLGSSGNWLVLAAFLAAVSVPSSPVWDGAFILFGSPILILAALRCGAANWVSRYGAQASYGIYAIHWPLLLIGAGTSRRVGVNGGLACCAVALGILAIAPLLDRYFDRPIRRRLLAVPSSLRGARNTQAP